MRDNAGRKILVVDDTPSIRIIAKKMLEREGFVVTTASDAFDAEEILKKEKFDLIVLDIMMPEKSGYEFCEELRDKKEFEDIPILFLTAKQGHLDRVQAYGVGGSDYLTKPFLHDLLTEKVNELLEENS